jgi:hypothetical protein
MTRALILFVTSMFISGFASHAAGDRFVQDRFAIGFWVDPPMDSKMEENYKQIADANFTLVLGGFSANNLGKARKQLHLCEKFGLKALVWSGESPANLLPNSPACWGYTLRDEPSAEDFPALRKRSDEIHKFRPGRIAYINLFPDYADNERLGTANYEEHLRRFVEEVKPDVLSMDHYPRFKPDGDGRDGYCRNLEAMRKASLEANIPFWNFFNTMPYGPHTDPTESQLRWQIYTSIAFGAKGVLYFCYYTPLSPEFPKGGAIIGRDGRPTRHYDQARRINGEIKNLGPTLMQLTSTGTIRIKPGDDPAQVLSGSPIKNLTRADHDPEFELLVGTFKHKDGRRAVLLNNYYFAYTAWPTVEFDTDLSAVREIDKSTGKERPIIDDSPDMEGLQVSLDAGEGRLFVVGKS